MVRLHPDIAEVADKFIRVRLLRIAGMDLRRFEFDYDLTWYVFLLNADQTIYGRYGGRDAADAHGRISLKGLRYALERALEVHKRPPRPEPFVGPPVRPEDFAAARRHKGCIHCHNINEFQRADLKAQGQWDRSRVWVYPLPENVGIALDIDVGNRVRAILTGSPAERTGLKPGDHVTQLNGYPVASFADASYALHKSPVQGSIPVAWTRQGQEQAGVLKLAQGWRRTNVTWRPSLLDLLPSAPFRAEDLTPEEKQALGLAETRAAFREEGPVHSTLRAAGLEPDDVVIGFDGQVVNGETSDLLGYVRRNYLVGDTVALNVLRKGKRVDLKWLLK